MIATDPERDAQPRDPGSRRAIRLGPTALRMLGRRRRWLRWLAVALAGLTLLSAVTLARRHGAPRSTGVPAVVVRQAIRAGQPIRRADVELVLRRPAVPGPIPFGSIADVMGRVAGRTLRPEEPVTSENAVSPVRYYGVAARVPRGMRAVNLVVPSASTFGGELAPQSLVDVLAAFEVGEERVAATLLTSGIVLRVGSGRDAPPPPAGRLAALPETQAGRPGSLVEVVVAVPEARGREVALAQAFGHIFLAVHALSADAVASGPPTVVNLRNYLNLPSTPRAAMPSLPGWRPPAAGMSQSTIGSGVMSGGSGGLSGGPQSPARSTGPATPRSEHVSQGPVWSVEVITGAGDRSVEQVPREDDHQAPETDHVPGGRTR